MPNTTEDPSAALANCLTDAEFPELPNFQRGKVRDLYDLPDGLRVMVATDRQSAFDIVLGAVPYKGQVERDGAFLV